MSKVTHVACMSLLYRRRHQMPVILSLKNLIFITSKIVTRLRFAACSRVNMCVFQSALAAQKFFCQEWLPFESNDDRLSCNAITWKPALKFMSSAVLRVIGIVIHCLVTLGLHAELSTIPVSVDCQHFHTSFRCSNCGEVKLPRKERIT